MNDYLKLTTDLGDIDLFGEVVGIGGYKDVEALSITEPSALPFAFRDCRAT